MEIQVVKSKELSDWFDNRYVIINKETQEVVDDAQGYGYKSKEKALASWAYKNRNKKIIQKETAIKKWIKKHTEFDKLMEEYAWYAFKDGDKLDSNIVEMILKELNLQAPSNAKEIFWVWSKGHL